MPLGIEDIDRKYEILAKMGEGGMGEVYKARHLLLDEIRVIKTIRAQHRDDEDLQARFFREARVATQLRHPNIAQIHDFSVGDDGTACIVMEYVDGQNVAELVRKGPGLSPAVVLEIACQTLEALAYLHRRRVVHRDVSPDNVMLTHGERGEPRVKLIDLGIAKPQDEALYQTRTELFIGKVRYASPEQLGGSGGGIDGRSDLYSLAVMVYELLTGALPVTGTDQASLIAGHLFHPPRPFAETDPEGRVPAAVRGVLLRALAKRPEDRFATAEDFAAALDAARRGEVAPELDRTVRAAPAPPATPAPEPAPASGRRRPRWLGWPAAAAAAALVLAVVAAVAWTGRGGDDPGEDETSLSADQLAGLDFGTFRALVVGNDNYESLPRLETAVRDAREVARVLEERYGFEVRLLTDATRGDVLGALFELTSSAGPADNLLVYYAGHGWLDARAESGYWQPVDSLPMDTSQWINTRWEVTNLLEQSRARHVLVVADSCYSGSLADPDATTAAADPATGSGRERVAELLRRRTRLALTSGGLAPVLDSGGGRHSIFGGALIQALESSDGVIGVEQLHRALVERVTAAAAALGAAQDPELAPIPQGGHEGGSFFFVPRALAASAESFSATGPAPYSSSRRPKVTVRTSMSSRSTSVS